MNSDGPWRNPTPTVDVVVETPAGIVLIQRRTPPHGWALPGGFVDEGERVEDAARREVLEETGLRVTLETLLYVYSDPERDPRKHTLSVVFVGQADGVPEAMDDAAAVRLFRADELPDQLAFDHGEILRDYLSYRSTGERPKP